MLGAVFAAPAGAAEPPTPQLIDAAAARGDISSTRADVLRGYALTRPRLLPPEYRSPAPGDGTLTLLELRDSAAKVRAGSRRDKVEAALRSSSCDTASSPLANTTSSSHYFVE